MINADLTFDSVQYCTALQISTKVAHSVNRHFSTTFSNSTPVRLLNWHPLSKSCNTDLIGQKYTNISIISQLIVCKIIIAFSILLITCNRTFCCEINSQHSEWLVINFSNFSHCITYLLFEEAFVTEIKCNQWPF